MCLVSVVSDGVGNQIPPYGRLENWPPSQVLELAEIIKRLDAIDQKLGLKDCKDDTKEAFIKDLQERVEAIERTMNSHGIYE